MKTYLKVIFVALIFLLVALHRILFSSKDGFYDTGGDYDALRRRLQNDLGDYCKLAGFIYGQVTQMQQGLKAIASSLPSAEDIKAQASNPAAKATQALMAAGRAGPLSGESWADYGNDAEVSLLYKSVYTCTDTLAKYRPSCGSPNFKMNYVPCSTYLDLPSWSDEDTVNKALGKITDDLAERLNREADWFEAVMNKVQDGLNAGAKPQAGDNPPGVVPSVDQMNKLKEELEGFTCSPDAMALLRQKKLEKELKSCKPITASSEIDRVNGLLDNPSVASSVNRMRRLYEIGKKLQSDLEKLKNGTLYDWQKDGGRKSYTRCATGNRLESLICSIKQNMT
jgi:hypothetical protein